MSDNSYGLIYLRIIFSKKELNYADSTLLKTEIWVAVLIILA